MWIKMLNTVPSSVPKKLAAKIALWEQDTSGRIVVELKTGWKFKCGCHMTGADSMHLAVQQVASSTRCDCESCFYGDSPDILVYHGFSN